MVQPCILFLYNSRKYTICYILNVVCDPVFDIPFIRNKLSIVIVNNPTNINQTKKMYAGSIPLSSINAEKGVYIHVRVDIILNER
jgi:hypothetical protein